MRPALPALLIVIGTLPALPAAARGRPNVVLIIGDDISARDCGACGTPAVRTPHLDRLASEGVLFERAFVSASSCSPSRASLLTGRYPHATGAEELHWPLPADQVTVSELLRKAGYYTAAAGKWHLGPFAVEKFDEVRPAELVRDKSGKQVSSEGGNASGAEQWVPALRARPRDRPFFMWLAALDAHRPYEDKILATPHRREDVTVPPYLPDTPEVRKDLALYYDEITRLDGFVGEVLAELERQGVAQNTLVLYTADNGMPFPRAKVSLYDSGIATPLIARWPGRIKPGGRSKSLVSLVDVAPTILDVLGLPAARSLQGRSFAPVLRDPQAPFRAEIFAEQNWHDFAGRARAVRTQRWKYIRNEHRDGPLALSSDNLTSPTYAAMKTLRDAGRLTPAQRAVFTKPLPADELYDLETDPDELHNLAADAAHAKTLALLRGSLDSWARTTGDRAPAQLAADEFDRETGAPLPNRVRPRLPPEPPAASWEPKTSRVRSLRSRPTGKPNIVVVITDDQGWGDLKSHGNDKIDTPVLDALARSGAELTRFYVNPVCAPTRAALLTGRYNLRAGAFGVTRGWETMRADEITLAEALKGAGYATGAFGKWHNGAHFPNNPNGQGFDEFFGFCGGHFMDYFDAVLERNGKPARTRGFISDVLTNEAMAFMERNRRRPFFLYVPYNAPHAPYQAPDRLFEKYKARGFDAATASVYGMVENIDDNVGRLLKKIDALDLARETIVVFMTDNGPNGPRYNGVLRGRKGSVDEGGVRVPFFVRWPGRIPPRARVDTIAAHIDVLPTLLDLAGVPPPAGAKLDGQSLRPLLLGLPPPPALAARTLFVHQARAGEPLAPAPGAARTQRLLYTRDKGRESLFDIEADPAQANDLSAKLPAELARLRAAYDAWFRDVTSPPPAVPPIAVGHAEAPVIELPAPEARMTGGLRYFGKNGYAHDWITGWTSTDARASWDIDVVRPARFRVEILHTCKPGDEGARLRVSAGAAALDTAVKRPHDPPLLLTHDRVERSSEVHDKRWAILDAGVLTLPAGRATLTIEALTKPGASVIDLKAIRLRRLAAPVATLSDLSSK